VQVRDVFATPADVTAQKVPAGGALDLHFHVYNGGDTPELMVANAPALITGVGVVAGAVAVPAHGQLWVGGPGSAVTASIPHAPQPMWVGTYLPLTLQFNNAGHVDLTVPIEDASDLLS
jgi:hypothetical protein